jgi:hypothetical protein
MTEQEKGNIEVIIASYMTPNENKDACPNYLIISFPIIK